MSDHPWILLTESQPTLKHANNEGQVNYQMNGWSMSASWQCVPKDATHWQMIVDAPSIPAARWEEIQEQKFQTLLKKEFPDPTVSNILIQSTLRKFFFHGRN